MRVGKVEDEEEAVVSSAEANKTIVRRFLEELAKGNLGVIGAVWYADVPNMRCARVAEGGEVLQTIELDLGCFACMLGGEDGRTLFIVAQGWYREHGRGGANGTGANRAGRRMAVEKRHPRAVREPSFYGLG